LLVIARRVPQSSTRPQGAEARLLPSRRCCVARTITIDLEATKTRNAWRLALLAQTDKLNRKDGAMKLTSAQVERTMSQFEVQALPDNHPAVPELNELFGEHTFLLDSNGLNILEPADGTPRGEVQAARVINLANWSGDNLTKLAPHEPQPTGAIVELATARH
jgi:hypothetical protein